MDQGGQDGEDEGEEDVLEGKNVASHPDCFTLAAVASHGGSLIERGSQEGA